MPDDVAEIPPEHNNVAKIHDAWDEEGSISRLGMRPAADREIQKALIPPGGDWRCIAQRGAITRSIIWKHTAVALINPQGDMEDQLEGKIAMGFRATPVMDRALRVIFILASAPGNAALIAKIARAAIDYVEKPAPAIREPEEDEEPVE